MDTKTRSLIDHFIDHSFRDRADYDYIAARLSYKVRLIDNFLWSASQAIEKYLKAILLYHGRDTRNLSHDLVTSLERVTAIQEIEWDFSDGLKEFVRYLDLYGNNRYFSFPQRLRGDELFHLDATVWIIRRYCQDFTQLKEEGRLLSHLRYLRSEECNRVPHKFRLLPNGHLERVLDTNHFAEQRTVLIWKNFRFGHRKKHKIRAVQIMSFATPTPYLRPTIFRWLNERVKFPKQVQRHFEARTSE